MAMTPKQTDERGPWDSMPDIDEERSSAEINAQQQPWEQLPDFTAPQPQKFDLSAGIAFDKEDQEKSSRILRVADESQLPVDFVERNLDQLEKDIAKKGFNPEKYRQDNPIVSDWLAQNPHYFSAARNDLDFLARIEKDVTAAGDRFQQLVGGGMRTALLMAPEVANLLPAQIRVPLQESIKQSDVADELEMLGESYKSVMAGKQDRVIEQGTTWEDFKDQPLRNLVPYIISTGIVSAPDMAAALINLPGYISMRGGELAQERAVNKGQTDATLGDLITVMPTTVAMSALERIGAKGILGVDEAVRTFGDVPVAVLRSGAVEGGTEFVQEQMEYAVTTLSTDVDFDIAQSFERGIAGAVGGAGYGAAVRTTTAPVQVFMHQRKAQQRQRFFEALGGDSEMREKLPTKMQEAVDKLTKNGPLETMYVPIDAHNEYWQSQGVDPREAAEQAFGSASYYDDGAASGMMEVPTAAYAAFGAGTDANEFYSRNTTFNPQDMTDSEFEAVMRRMQEDDAEVLRDVDGETPQQSVYNSVYGQIQPMYTPDVADKYARYMSIVFDTLAQRTGTTATELYNSYDVNIRREIPQAMRDFGGEAEVRNVLGMMRTGTIPTEDEVYGMSIVDMLRTRGIRDDGGEIANRDLDVGQRGRRLINRATAEWTLDDAAEWAYEQGIIQENDQTAFIEALDAELQGERFQTESYNPSLASVREFSSMLEQQLDEMGVSMDTLTDDQIIDALFRGADLPTGQELEQSAQTQTQEFKQWFGDSQVVDEDGEPLVVYHGTGAQFDVFDYDRIGQQGRTEGAGFYFTDDPQQASVYGSPMPVFLSIQKPLNFDAPGFSKDEISGIIRNAAQRQAEFYGEDIADGFISNFADVRTAGLESAISRAANLIVNGDTAVDQLSGLVGSGLDPEFLNRAVIDVTGYDGIYSDGYNNTGGDGAPQIYVAFTPEQIKSATANRGTFDPNDPVIFNQFAGEQSQKANMEALAEAKSLLDGGASNESVRRKTGWFKGVDGRWRYEISDDGATLKDGLTDLSDDESRIAFYTLNSGETRLDEAFDFVIEAFDAIEGGEPNEITQEWISNNKERIISFIAERYSPETVSNIETDIDRIDISTVEPIYDSESFRSMPLDEAMDHDKLYAAYPQLRNYTLELMPEKEYGGVFFPNSKTIKVNVGGITDGELKSIILHEVQHAIQEIEDFARGGSPNARFTDRVKETVESAAENERLAVEWWDSQNADTVEAARENAEIARNALKWQSVQRLLDYADRDKPSGVFRNIRNEAQWIYHDNNIDREEAREIERMFYGIPKRGPKRNAVIREIAERTAIAIRKSIPSEQIAMFKEDTRQLKSMVKALEREAAKVREAISPRGELERRARAADQLYEATKNKNAFGVYRSLAGEVEARTTQARANLTDMERANRSVRLDMDTPPEEAIVIVGGQEFLVPDVAASVQEQEGTRGSIRFDPTGGLGRSFTITIGENADLSTFLHESGHLFLEIMMDLAEQPGAPQQIVNDVQTLFREMGVENRSQVGRDQHEMFAEWTEKYLAEGRAPIAELRRLFVTFWSWLKRIYRNIDVIGITKAQLSDDVRRVMDRMIATDDMLDAQGDTEQLYKSFGESGMTPDEWAEYLRGIEEVRYEAQEQVATEIMDEYEKTQKKWWKERRREVRKRIEKQVSEERVYRALDVLQRGKAPDGGERPEGVKAIKLSKDSIVDLMGEGFLKRLPRPYVYTRDGGMEVQSAASMLGYDDASQLLSELATAQNKKERINQLTDDEMQRLYGDENLDATLPQMVLGAIHNERMADVLEIELRSLGRKASKRVTPRRLVREQAERIIDGKQARMVKPHLYRRAEQKAANAAFEAAMDGDNLEALRQKQMQMLNFELFRAAQRAQELESKLLDKARGLMKKSAQERIGKSGSDYLEQINGILEQYEFKRTTDRELSRRESLRAWIAEKEREGEFLGEEIDVPAEVLDRANAMNYRELPIAEMRGIYDLLRQIEHFARMKNKLLANQKRREREQAEQELISAVEANMKKKKKMPLSTQEMKLKERMTSLSREMDASLLKMEQVVDWLDDGDVDGPWHEILFNPVIEAQAKEQEYTELVTSRVTEALMDVPKETRNKMLDRVGVLNDGTPITRRSVIGMALNVGNESNMLKLMKGYGLTEAQLKTWLDILTKEEWDFVQRVWDTLEEIYPDIAALEKELRGIEPEKVEAKSVQTKFGEYAGGYYPVIYDFKRTEQGEKQLASNIGGLMDTNYVRSTTPKGHTMGRIEGFAAPIDLNIDRLSLHIAGVVKDLTHRKWLIDANWVVNNKAIMKSIEDAMGVEYRSMFKDWVRNTVNDRNVDMRQTLGTWNSMFETLRLNMMVATMGIKATTMISQIAGLGPSVEVVGGREGDGLKWMRKAFTEIAFDQRKVTATWQMIKEKSPEMRYRLQNKDRDIRNKLRQLSGKSDLLSQIQEISLQGIGYADLLVTIPTWMAGYNKALSQGKSEATAIKEGDRAVRLSQGSGGAKDLAAVQSRSGQIMRLLTMYYTPFNAMHNRLRNAGHEFGGIRDLPKAFFTVWWATILPAVMGELLVGRAPEEDEDVTGWLLKTVTVYASLGIPFVRDIMGAATSGFGYSFTPLQQVGTKTSLVLKDIGELATGDKPKDEVLQKLALDTFRASGYWLGIPTSQLEITGGYMYDLATGEDDSEDAVRKFLYRRDED